MSLYLLLYMVVGGEKSFLGPIIGAFFLSIVSELTRSLREYQPMMIGGLSILVLFFLPEGLVSLPGRIKAWWKNSS
jgi:urea transport system permease protein